MVNQEKAHYQNPDKLKRGLNLVFQRRVLWGLLFIIWLLFLRWWIVRWSWSFGLPTERYTFIAQQAFNGLVFTAVVVQALIYQGQLRVMSVAINPRLRITNVETTSFEVGKTPVFIVTLSNEGATDAQDVAMYLKAESDPGTGTNWQKEQVVTIPAHGKREYFIRLSGPLAQDLIDAVNDGKKTLKVMGSYQYAEGKAVGFCYKFWPWPFAEPRPERLPYFIPCDLVTAQNFTMTAGATGRFTLIGENIELRLGGVQAVSAAGTLTASVGKPLEGQVTPQGQVSLKRIKGDKTNEKREHDQENPN